MYSAYARYSVDNLKINHKITKFKDYSKFNMSYICKMYGIDSFKTDNKTSKTNNFAFLYLYESKALTI